MSNLNLYRRLLILLLSSLSFQLYAETEFKIITLQYRFASDILPIIEPMVEAEGSVSAMQNNLIIRTSSKNMAEIEQMIATMDRLPQTFKISISHKNTLDAKSSTYDINGRQHIGNIAIENNHQPYTDADSININLQDNNAYTNYSNHQFINVIDGKHAFIRVGQSIPFTQEWVTLTNRYASIQRITEFAEISTGFSVYPRSIGNQIELQIMPSIMQFNQSNAINFEQLATTIRVNKHEWVDLGGIMEHRDEVSRKILSLKTVRADQKTALKIRID